MDEYVAISVQIRKHFARISCELPYRDFVCTGTKDIIMVLVFWRTVDPDDATMEVMTRLMDGGCRIMNK